MSELTKIGIQAKQASKAMSIASQNEKNQGLLAMAQAIVDHKDTILEANRADVERAKKSGMTKALIDRLTLHDERIDQMAQGIKDVVKLEDPVGEVLSMWQRPNGLSIGRQRVPLGVVGIIYESRPNVTADAAALCIKTGNCVILRGGSDAIASNLAIVHVIRDSLKATDLPVDCVQIIEDTNRQTAQEFMRMNEWVDVLIPRGGAGLIKNVVENATVPVIETGVGNCHVYIDQDADHDMALAICVNSKTNRPSVCNAAETVLIARKEAKSFLPLLKKAMYEHGVQMRCCDESYALCTQGIPDAADESYIVKAEPMDWETEFLDLILAVKIVENMDEAIEHIDRYGTMHTEAIVTQSYQRSQAFLKRVDAAAVLVNASTRFTDGGQFGFGAEIGISTQKLHARGPMGLKELTTYKTIIYGNGQIRS